jgi:predicted nucleic acid-binding protein
VQTSVSAVYLDSSAIVKLAVAEAESGALQRFLARFAVRVSSIIARVEVERAVRVADPDAILLAREILASIEGVRLTDSVLNLAAEMQPPLLRSLDAIHIASALVLQPRLEALVSYDRRMVEAAQAAGLPTATPS